MRTGLICALLLAAGLPLHADGQWIRAKLGSFEAISDAGRTPAIQALSQFEQFRYALGVAMGQPDLKLDPPLRIIVFHDEKSMDAKGCRGIRAGRDHLMACAVSNGNSNSQLPPELIRALTRRLLEANFTGIPAKTEAALETFFSTVQSNGVHVTWGAPPAPAERTRDWALLHRMITQPDTSGRAHIYLHNLANGMDSNGAIRSLGEDVNAFNADVDRYFTAGVYNAVQAPNRPLNPERDFNTTVLTSDEGRLAHADLLGTGAEADYQVLLKAGKFLAQANEGLGFLALNANNPEKAREYFEAARKAGTRNVIALTALGKMQKNYDTGIQILKEALTIDPKYAPAHWELGDKIDDAPRRLAEWKQATALDPHNVDWWVSYAKLNEGQKQWAEAGRAWVAAAEATSDPMKRLEYLNARGSIDGLRMEDEAAQRRREADEKAAEIERLKAEAKRELREAEAKANLGNKPVDASTAVDWWDDKSATLAGTLTRVDCAGNQLKLEVRETGGATRTLLVDPAGIDVQGGDHKFACGPQKPRAVVVHYTPSTVKGLFGQVTALEYR